MYDQVNIKSVIISAASAAVISVAAGGIGGVSPGTLVLRALLFAAVFAVGTALISVIVDRFLPELTGGGSAEEESYEVEDEKGGSVDIVMDDKADGTGVDPAVSANGMSPAHPGGSVLVDDVQIAGETGGFQPASAAELAGGGKGLPDIGVFSSVDDEEGEDEGMDEMNATEAPGSGDIKSRFASMQTNDEDKKDFFQNSTTAEDMAKGVRTMLKSDEKKG